MRLITNMPRVDSSLGPDRICVRCSAAALDVVSETKIVCRSCKKEYPILEGIPVLVDNFAEHQEYLQDAMKGREEWFDSQQIVTEDSMWAHQNIMMTALLRALYCEHVGHGKQILDLGCGDGRNRAFLKTVASRVIATDYNILRVARAQESGDGYDDLFMSDILALPLPDNSCEVIHFDQVLEHIPQPERALASVHRVLREDGVLMLGVPNEGCWYHQLKFRVKPSLLKKTDHVNFFTLKSLSDLLGRSGFRVKDARGMAWGMPVLGHGLLLGSISKLEATLRRYRWYNELWESAGRLFLPGQYFVLYVVAEKRKK